MPKAIKQFFVVAAVVAISMVFIIQFRPGADVKTAGGPKCAMEVGSTCLSYTEFLAAYRMAAPQNANAERLEQLRLRPMVAQGLLERWVLNEDAKRLGISVSDEEVTAQLGRGLARAR